VDAVGPARAFEAAIAEAAREELPDIAGALGRLQALVQLRLGESNGSRPEPEPPPEADRLLDVNEAAARLGVDARWIYDRSGTLPFVKRLGPRTLRFSERGIDRWLRTRR